MFLSCLLFILTGLLPFLKGLSIIILINSSNSRGGGYPHKSLVEAVDNYVDTTVHYSPSIVDTRDFSTFPHFDARFSHVFPPTFPLTYPP